MINKWKILPVELVSKIMLYSPIEPLHFKAYKTGIRIITSCELNCKIIDKEEMKLEVTNEQQTMVDEEWFLYLLEQQYEI